MSSKRSVAEILASLEMREALHEEREAFHASQEVHHREQRAAHAAELEKVRQRLAAFREAAASAVEIVDQPLAETETAPAVSPAVKSKLSGRLIPSRVVRAVIATLPADEPFGPTAVATETNRRHADTLDRALDARTVSDVLRRMRAEGSLHLVQEGKAFHEALYSRRSP